MNYIKPFFVIIILGLLVACNRVKKEEKEWPVIVKEIYKDSLASGNIDRIIEFPSNYVRDRNVDIWMPESYNENEKYAVLYMHDGQMLFDASTTWNKQEWRVDEIMSTLIASEKIKKTIVVAIWNHSDIRWTDYYPHKPFFKYLPEKFRDSLVEVGKKQLGDKYIEFQSDYYLKFIVEELKPYIDSQYSVYTDLNNTVIAGASMGGLISMYAICEYPEIFGGAACLSTHWPGMMPFENNPLPESFFSYMEENLPSPEKHRIYFDYGTETLDESYLPYQHRVNAVLNKRGFDNSNSRNMKFDGHDHSENSWNKRFDIPVQFLLNKE